MHDLGYVAAGYALTATTFAWYRWRLLVRERGAARRTQGTRRARAKVRNRP